MAIAVALLATIASFGLASAAVVATVDSQHGTTRDHNSKESIAAADAGASMAMLRLNRYGGALNSTTPCLGESAGSIVLTGVAADGWCPEVKGTVGESTYAYRTTPKTASGLSVVAVGSSGTVRRRIDIGFKAQTAGSALAAEGLIGQEGITFSGNADIRVGVGTNGQLTSSGNATICNNIRFGVGKKWEHSGNASQCSGYVTTEGNATLPPVSSFMPPTIANSNSNGRLVTCTRTSPTPEPPGCQSDTFTGSWKTNSPFNPTTRSISVQGGVLTLGGGDYWLCSLTLSGNSHLIMAAEANVRLFFDTPENCGGNTQQISFTGNSNIEATGYQPEAGKFGVMGIYMLGSTTKRSSINLAGNTGANELVVYAPNTDINVSGNADYKGVMAGRTINDSGNGKISQDTGFEPPVVGGATLFSRESYVECVGGTGSTPSSGC